jgi:hypothetical protein
MLDFAEFHWPVVLACGLFVMSAIIGETGMLLDQRNVIGASE